MEHTHSWNQSAILRRLHRPGHAKHDQELLAKDTFSQKGEQRMSAIQGFEKTDKTTSWTIMLYIAADDTLANFAVGSLKQLNKSASAPAGYGDQATVVVAAQFALPADDAKQTPGKSNNSGGQNKRQYIFKPDSSTKRDADEVKLLPKFIQPSAESKASSSEKEGLKEFLKWAYEKCPSEHYALILWGHGPELLFQPTATNASGSANLYLTPEELREALSDCKPPNKDHLDIIGFDACYMSMLEMACELNGLADFMVASQEEVPDLSFPYDNLIGHFRRRGSEPPSSLLSAGVKAYVGTYQDCICNNNTSMKEVTLSVLDLNKCDPLKNAVCGLAHELLAAKEDKTLPCAMIGARQDSQDYAGGLYVDLFEFCTNLSERLKNVAALAPIKVACEKVLGELTEKLPGVSESTNGHRASEPPPDRPKLLRSSGSAILANSGDIEDGGSPGTSQTASQAPDANGSSSRKRSHGISIYLPYLTDEQYATVSRPLVKGGRLTNGGKGYTEMLNGAAVEYLMCARRELILDTESYYEGLQLARITGWYDVIADLWTKALIKEVPADLDYHYSAQQSWINVSRKAISDRKPEPATEPLTECAV